MTTFLPVLCNACAHFDPDRPGVCRAYPAGIPAEIGLFGEDHRRPRPGDHGVQFELAGRPGARQALTDWTKTFSVPL